MKPAKIDWDGGAEDRDAFCCSGGFHDPKNTVKAKVLERKVRRLVVYVPSLILIN